MRPGSSWFRALLAFLFRTLFGAAAGVALGVAWWIIWLTVEKKSVTEALQGNVEDALATLEGLAALGTLVGTAVGLLYGFMMLVSTPPTEK
jgi:hypothetical protein